MKAGWARLVCECTSATRSIFSKERMGEESEEIRGVASNAFGSIPGKLESQARRTTREKRGEIQGLCSHNSVIARTAL